MTNLTTSPATLADIPRLVDVINGCYRGESSKAGWTTEADIIEGDLRTDAENLAELMANERATILKCVHESEGILGSVYLEQKGDRLYLGMLSVDTTKQSSGIGKRLLLAAEEHARSLGCKAIFMQVISVRAELIAYYERHGYRLTGERKPFDGDPRFGRPRMPLEFAFMEKGLVGGGR